MPRVYSAYWEPAVKSGDEIEFHCDGPDEKEALETMVKAVEDGLGE